MMYGKSVNVLDFDAVGNSIYSRVLNSTIPTGEVQNSGKLISKDSSLEMVNSSIWVEKVKCRAIML
jgi:hypothetical protein